MNFSCLQRDLEDYEARTFRMGYPALNMLLTSNGSSVWLHFASTVAAAILNLESHISRNLALGHIPRIANS